MNPVACFLLVFLVAKNDVVDGAIGMNWGRQSAQRLIPSMVVDLLLQNGIREARIYTTQVDILQAFTGTGISLSLAIPNTIWLDTYYKSAFWVQRRVQYFSGANVRRVYIGEQVFKNGLTDKSSLVDAIQALQCLQEVLDDAGYGDQIKVTFTHSPEILKTNITRPSEAEFRDEIKDEMVQTLQILQRNNAPFAIEMFPIVDLTYNNFEASFAFPDNKSTTVVTDKNGAVYTNIVEFTYDAFIWAMKKLNFTTLDVMISQIGWPTDGHPAANVTAAEYFFKHLLPWVTSNRGTPMRPGKPVDTYIHSLMDENKMPYTYPFSRHWGIYRSNGMPKYKIDLSGQGRDIYPTMIKRIRRMPGRWCMFNGNTTDYDKVEAQFNYACQQADCTSLAPGGSCSQLSYNMNISYAFNMHFQFQFQDEEACDFDGLGFISVDDPSAGECVFPVEVVKGKQDNFHPNTGKGFHETPNCAAILVIVLSILGTLFRN